MAVLPRVDCAFHADGHSLLPCVAGNLGGIRTIPYPYFLQLAANILWSFFFFGMRNLLFPWRPCSTPPS
uniref:Uncharacterized protein n=1 Tax=Candidatus Caldatribacterium californiense TaxID=1454726 RepID=A0A7V3YMA1_9BACT